MNTTLRDIVYSFIQSIDLFNYLLKNHHRRVAIIAWHIGKTYGLDSEQMSRLILSAAMHDIGALSVEERDELIKMDIDNPHPHAKLGAYMLDSFEPFKDISKIVFYHHWSFSDHNQYIQELGPVPIESYIIHLADRIDILIDSEESIMMQTEHIIQEIEKRNQSLFHPDVCKSFKAVASTHRFWMDIENKSMQELLNEVPHKNLNLTLNLDLLEDFAFTVSKIIDCRSKFTVSHSFGVSAAAYQIAVCANKDEETCRKLRVAGLLHDIGKIGVDVSLIEKEGPLTAEERIHVESHAYYTSVILGATEGVSDIASWASHHHENHKGGGYPDHYERNEITEEMDILSYADVFTALLEDRPYRSGLELERIIGILQDEFEEKHGTHILDVIKSNSKEIYSSCKEAIRDGAMRYDVYEMMSNKYANEYSGMTSHH